MALSQPLARNNTTDNSTPTATPSSAAAEGSTVSRSVDDLALKLDALYNSASRLEVEFEGLVRHNTPTPTAGQVGAYNAVLKLARELVPHSVALREDVDDIDATTRPADAHKALHVTIVPTLHNALPEPVYDRHG